MAKKRFTFADAKERIKELEAQVEDLQGILADEFDKAEEDIIEDFKKVGYGDVAFILGGAIVGAVLTALGIWIF